MRLEISSQGAAVRATIVNDSFAAVPLSRNAFTGPTPVTTAGAPAATSVEPTQAQSDEPMTLQPFTFYGRERDFANLPAGEHEFTAEYQPTDGEPLTVKATVTISG